MAPRIHCSHGMFFRYYTQRWSINRLASISRCPSSSRSLSSLPRYSHRRASLPVLPQQFLQASNNRNYDPTTHQRNDVAYDPIDGRPPLRSSADHDGCHVSLEDFSPDWVRDEAERWRSDPADFDRLWNDDARDDDDDDDRDAGDKKTNHVGRKQRVLWSGWTEEMIRDPAVSPVLFRYDVLSSNQLEEERLLSVLFQYGLALVTATPTETASLPSAIQNPDLRSPRCATKTDSAEEAILKLASITGYHPLHTLYGSGVWSTSSQSSFYNTSLNDHSDASSGSTADSAYGSTSLPLHTDMTYASNPPGLQIFLMVQPASSPASASSSPPHPPPLGQSVYLDGFAAAHQLRSENPHAFHLLASTKRTYRCVDHHEGYHLEASGPIIQANCNDQGNYGPVTSIRHNDLDRMPDLPPYSPVISSDMQCVAHCHHDEYYRRLQRAHEAWDDILRRDEFRLVLHLRPGDCVLVANQRCLHGRYAFETNAYPRVVMGCYVGMDELASKWRRNGHRVLC